MNNFMKNLHFGFASSTENVVLSPFGIAVQSNEDKFCAYDSTNEELIDVTETVFSFDKGIFMQPVGLTALKPGDCILHTSTPLFVSEVKDRSIRAIDPTTEEVRELKPAKSLFGFDFFTKYTPLFNMSDNLATPEKPFGEINPLILMALAGDSSESNSLKDIAMMSMIMNENGKDQLFSCETANPLILWMLLNNKEDKGGSESTNFFEVLMVGQMMKDLNSIV